MPGTAENHRPAFTGSAVGTAQFLAGRWKSPIEYVVAMSPKLLPVDEVWGDRMVALARVPWERAMVEAMFVEWGLARPAEHVEWEGVAREHRSSPPLWTRKPAAGRAEFHAERDRLAALVTSRLGAPEVVVTGAYDSYRAVWRCDDRALLVETSDDISSYSHYDVLCIRLRLYSPQLADLGA
jgi:hypothetical protein